MLKVISLNGSITGHLLWCCIVSDWLLHLVATTNQRRPLLTHEIWKFQTKLESKHSHDISPGNFHLYQLVANEVSARC